MKRITVGMLYGFALNVCGAFLMGTIGPAAAQAQPCGLGALNGSYGYSLSGVTLKSPQNKQIALGGTFTADGAGNLTSAGGIANLGGAIRSQSGTGTYTANPNCTGKITINFTGFLPLTADYFLISAGQRALLVQTDKGGVASGEFDKQ
jgi:hypothetical protein